MSYRTKVNGVQIFGNNEYYEEWIEFIQAQGIEVSAEGYYEGEITDFMGALEVVEKITLRLEKERRERKEKLEENIKNFSEEEKKIARSYTYGTKSIFDLSNIYDDIIKQDKNDILNLSLFDKLKEYINSGYMFMPYTLYLACKDKLEEDKCFAVNGHFDCFKIKDGETISVVAR